MFLHYIFVQRRALHFIIVDGGTLISGTIGWEGGFDGVLTGRRGDENRWAERGGRTYRGLRPKLFWLWERDVMELVRLGNRDERGEGAGPGRVSTYLARAWVGTKG